MAEGQSVVTFMIDVDTTAGTAKLRQFAQEVQSQAKQAEQATGQAGLAKANTEQARTAKDAAKATDQNAKATKAQAQAAKEADKAAKALARSQQQVAMGFAEILGQLPGINRFMGASGFAGGAGVATAVLGGMSIAALYATKQLADLGQQFDDIQRGFRTLSQKKGGDPIEFLQVMRRETRGLVDDMKLMLTANEAMILGLPVTADSLGKITKNAILLGRTMGVDVDYALKSVVIGIGRQSRLWLDNIGIIVKAEQAYESYARKLGKSVNALTTAEQKLAFYEEAMRAMEEASAGLEFRTDSLSMSFDIVAASATNAKNRFALFLNRALAFPETADQIKQSFDEIAAAMERLEPSGRSVSKVLDEIVGGKIRDLWELPALIIKYMGKASDKTTEWSESLAKLAPHLEDLGRTLEGIGEGTKKDLGVLEAWGALLQKAGKWALEHQKAMKKVEEAKPSVREQLGIEDVYAPLGRLADIDKAIEETITLRDEFARKMKDDTWVKEVGGIESAIAVLQTYGRQLELLDERRKEALRDAGALPEYKKLSIKPPPELREELLRAKAALVELRAEAAKHPEDYKAWQVSIAKVEDTINEIRVKLGELPEGWKKQREEAEKLAEALGRIKGMAAGIEAQVLAGADAFERLNRLMETAGPGGGAVIGQYGFDIEIDKAEADFAALRSMLADGKIGVIEYEQVMTALVERWETLDSTTPQDEIWQLSEETRKAIEQFKKARTALEDLLEGYGPVNPAELFPQTEILLPGSAREKEIQSLIYNIELLNSVQDEGVRHSDEYAMAMQRLGYSLVELGVDISKLPPEIQSLIEKLKELEAWKKTLDLLGDAEGGMEFGDLISSFLEIGQVAETTAVGLGQLYSVLDSTGKAFSATGLERAQKTMQKIQATMLFVTGLVAFMEGAVKVATSIFPPNPPQLASGVAMMAKGAAAMSTARQLGAQGGAAPSAGGGGAGAQEQVAYRGSPMQVVSYAGRPAYENPYLERGQDVTPPGERVTVNIYAMDSKSLREFLVENPSNREIVGEAAYLKLSGRA